MKPEERENFIYKKGKINKIEKEEKALFGLLPKDPEGKRLLDIGCGVGDIAYYLKRRGFSVKGIDFSKVAVQKSKEKGIDAGICDVDQVGLPFEGDSFDVIWATDVIEHVFDPMNLISEMARVIKPSGEIFITVPNDFNVYARLLIAIKGHSIQSGIYRRFGISKHHTFFSYELLKFMLQKHGMHINEYFSILFFPKSKKEKFTKNKCLGYLFGKIFILKLKVSK